MATCAACGRENPADARFCNGCGAALAAAPTARREERKVVTVLFADLVGFTSRAERLDPEDVRALLAPYWQHLRDELERFGGTVEKFIGDAVMALFGAPVAHEDDPERAVRAALAIRDWVREQEGLEARVAVNTGEALVLLDASPAEGEGMAAGDVVNTAARLQSAAPVNGVLVGEGTWRATRDAIEYAEREPVTAKGKLEPVPVWEALEARSRPSVETLSRGELVGRSEEVDLLVGAFHRVRRERRPQLVTIAGVPGIGKSRLVAELFRVLDEDPELITWRRGRSLSYGEPVSMWALGEIVKAEVGILESDSGSETEAKLEAALRDLVPDDDERAWVGQHLAPLVGLPAAEVDRSQSPAARRRWLELLAERHPLVLVFEDLQWADDELLDFADELVDWIDGVPLLVVATARPELLERRPGWGGGKRNALTISLDPLADADTARIVAEALGQALLPAETQVELLARAGGNPLYAEQFARMIAEGATADALPETVQGIVAARLDLLDPEQKALLQDAAVIGRAFWPGAVDADEERLRPLVRKEFVRRERRSSIAGESEYTFAHALVRDVAYAQIPRAARAERHRRAAAWIESLPADRSADRAELLAQHYGAALELAHTTGAAIDDLVGPARVAFREAGDRAASLNALGAAERYYTAALELWPSGDRGRAPILLARAEARMRLGGDAVVDAEEALALAPGEPEPSAQAAITLARACWHEGRGVEAVHHAEHAHELVRALPVSETKAAVLAERARLLMLNGENRAAEELATEAIELAHELALERLEAGALITRGTARGSRGGLEDLERGAELADRVDDAEQQHRALNNLAVFLTFDGRLDDAAAVHRRQRELNLRLGYEAGVRWVDSQLTVSDYVRGEWDTALEVAERLIGFDESGERNVLAGNAYLVRSQVRQARDRPGALADSARIAELARRSGDLQARVPGLCEHAIVLALEGHRADARELLDEVLEIYESTEGVPYAWAPPVARAFAEVGVPGEYRALLARVPPDVDEPWLVAARAAAEDDYALAADLYGSMGAPTPEAALRVHAARTLLARGDRRGSEEQLRRAIAFYRGVRATRAIRDAEQLLAATA